MIHRFVDLIAAETGSPPYVVAETSLGYAIWRVINGTPTRITPTPSPGTETDQSMTTPRLSPDGSKIAFDWNWPKPDFSGAIAVVDALGGTPFYVTPDDGGAKTFTHPSWHPGGLKVLYVYANANTLPGGEIYEVDITGSGTPTLLWTPNTQTPNQQEGGYRPHYSPDGTKIAFIVNVHSTSGGGSLARQGLWVMDSDGTNASLIDGFDTSNGNGGYALNGTQLAWANNSNVVAYASGGSVDAVREIYKINADGTGKTQLSNGSASGQCCRISWGSWLPDDSGVVCSIGAGTGPVTMWFLSEDGVTQTQLNSTVGPFPDESSIADGQLSNGYLYEGRVYFVADDAVDFGTGRPIDVSSFDVAGGDYRVDHDISSISAGFQGGEGFEWA